MLSALALAVALATSPTPAVAAHLTATRLAPLVAARTGADPIAVPPVTPVRVVRGFDPPASDYGPGHRGVDLAAAPGTAVRAPLAGTVSFAGPVGGRPVLSLVVPAASANRRLTFEPVDAVVSEGEEVEAGDLLGFVTLGHSGCPLGCLHWGLVVDGVYADPLRLLGRRGARLLPLGPGTAAVLTSGGQAVSPGDPSPLGVTSEPAPHQLPARVGSWAARSQPSGLSAYSPAVASLALPLLGATCALRVRRRAPPRRS